MFSKSGQTSQSIPVVHLIVLQYVILYESHQTILRNRAPCNSRKIAQLPATGSGRRRSCSSASTFRPSSSPTRSPPAPLSCASEIRPSSPLRVCIPPHIRCHCRCLSFPISPLSSFPSFFPCLSFPISPPPGGACAVRERPHDGPGPRLRRRRILRR